MEYNLAEAITLASVQPGIHFLGASPAEWTAAFVAAVVVAIIWEVGTALTRRVTKRLPFIVLRIARFGLPRDEWQSMYDGEWMPELHACLTDPEQGAFRRFLSAMHFAIPLAFGGAYRTAKALRPQRLASTKAKLTPFARRRRLRLMSAIVLVGSQGVYTLHGLFDSGPVIMYLAYAGMGVAICMNARSAFLFRQARRAARKK